MGACGRCLLISTLVLVVGVGILLNVTIPRGFQDATKLRLLFGAFKLMGYWMHLHEELYGLNTTIKTMRGRMEHFKPDVDTTGIQIRDTGFDGVNVRIYTPTDGVSSDAALISFHGGGWTFGSIDGVQQAMMVDMTQRLKITTVSVDYRLAPEHPYPIPLYDCVAATKYFLEHAADYGVDPDQVAVFGDSAGANLAAAVSLLLRDEDYDPMPKLQILIYPALQAIDFLTPSYLMYQDESLLSKRYMVRYWLLYAFGDVEDLDAAMVNMHTSSTMKKQMSHAKLNHKSLGHEFLPADYIEPDLEAGNSTLWEEISEVFEDHYFAPLMADDLSALPQAYIFTAEQDVLRDDSIWYAQRLRETGNEVTHEYSEASFHGLLSLSMFQDQHNVMDKIIQYLKKEL